MPNLNRVLMVHAHPLSEGFSFMFGYVGSDHDVTMLRKTYGFRSTFTEDFVKVLPKEMIRLINLTNSTFRALGCLFFSVDNRTTLAARKASCWSYRKTKAASSQFSILVHHHVSVGWPSGEAEYLWYFLFEAVERWLGASSLNDTLTKTSLVVSLQSWSVNKATIPISRGCIALKLSTDAWKRGLRLHS